MFKALLKTRISALFSMMFRGSKNKKSHGIGFKILIGLLAVYIVGVFAFLFGSMFASICKPFYSMGLSWLYFSLAGLMGFVFCFFMTIFMTKSQLFEAGDNEMLLSMPIPPKYILASRMFMLLLMNYLYELLVMIPAGVVYAMYLPVQVSGVIIFVLGVLFLPLLAMAFSCLFGWLVAIIGSRMRNKNLITLVFSIAFLGVYMYFFTQIQKYLEVLLVHGSQIGEAVKKALFPIYHMGLAIAESNFISLGIFLLCAVVPFAIVYWILAKNFIRITTTHKGTAKIRYKEKPMEVRAVRSALVQKELKRFTSCSMYMLNAGIGLLLMLALAVLTAVKRDALLQMFEMSPEMGGYMGVIMIVGLSFCAATVFISAPSISLEGKNLWILKSLPIDAADILMAKALTHMIITIPVVLLSATICDIAIRPNVLQMVMMYLLPVGIVVFMALFGVIINLHFPKFDWINETAAVKQGASPMICSLGAMTSVLVPFLLYIGIFSKIVTLDVYLIICLAFIIVLCAGLFWYLKSAGKKLFEQLQN